MMNLKNFFDQNCFGKIFTAILSVLILTSAGFAQQGALDTSFGTNSTGIYQDALPGITDTTNVARSYGPVEILADGKIVVAGSATRNLGGGNYVNDIVIRRLNANGSPDVTFAGGAGTVQTNFLSFSGVDTNMLAPVMRVQPSDGKIVLAAQCIIQTAPNPSVDNFLGVDLCLMRYNANGTLDTGFGGNTVQAWGGNSNFPATTYNIPGGKVWTYTGTDAVVPNRNGGFNGTPVRIQFAPDGRILVFGNSQDIVNNTISGSRTKGFVAVYSAGGTLLGINSIFDTTGNGTDGWGVTKIFDGDILSNGDFVVAGQQRRLVSSNPAVFSNLKWNVWRVVNNGAVTGNFLDAGNSNPHEAAIAITQVRSNKILVGGGKNGTPTLVRYNGDLTVDTSFGTNGRIAYDGSTYLSIDTFHIGSLKTQPDGKILATTNNGNIARFNPDGSLDKSFARIREDVADSLSLRGVLSNVRYITPFPTRPGTDARINFGGVTFRPNGRLVTAGNAGVSSPFAQAVVTQLQTSFRNGGTFSDLNNDGKSEIAVYRNSDGVWHSLDSFTGGYTPVQFGLNGDRIAPADYDGDGKADRAVFRNGIWYIFQSSNNQVRFAQWGSAGDLPRPGDFNGDGFADIAVFRPSNGVWYISYSNPIQPGNITTNIIQFGQNGDAPLLADFDGDGKSDVSVFRNGVWYFIRSGDGSIGIVNFGLAGDIPVAADYDADGKSDIAVFRNGVWYAVRSSDNSTLIAQFGIAGDKPVPGDYDNDGRSDLAIYRSGVWWILRSSDGGVSATNFGLATDTPIQSAYLP